MTQEELLENLAPIRLPLSFAEFTLRDGLLALSLGLFAGLLLSKLISLISVRRLSTTDQAQIEFERLSKLNLEARLVGLAAMLARLETNEADKLGLEDALYNPTASVDPSTIEQAILAVAGSRK